MKNVLLSVALMGACGVALAKLPPPDDAAKARAAETAARAGWQTKVDGYQLCRSQDRVVSHFRKTAVKAPPPAGPAPVAPGAPPAAQGSMTTAVAAAPAVAPASTPAAAAPGAPAFSPAAAAPGAAPATATAGNAPSTPCADPGPFAYTPPEQKPLEAAGAHSPTGTAVSPPSTNTPAAAMTPAKK